MREAGPVPRSNPGNDRLRQAQEKKWTLLDSIARTVHLRLACMVFPAPLKRVVFAGLPGDKEVGVNG